MLREIIQDFPACAVDRSRAKKLPRLSAGSVVQDELGLKCLFGEKEATVEVNPDINGTLLS